jgi:hypothetical protein
MPAVILHAAIGETSLGTLHYDGGRRRWVLERAGRTYLFRDPEDAAVALQMLYDEQGGNDEPV